MNADPPVLSLPESRLRDHLADNLHLIEAGLTLVEVEHRLPNSYGAAGSIDILARDEARDLVVIELKRQDQSARQALHELEKYVGLLAEARGIRTDQLRTIVLSTTWHELLLPFARFVSHVDFHAVGKQILLGEDGLPIGTEAIELPQLSGGLEVCPLHLSLLYSTTADRDAGRVAAQDRLEDLGIADYITFNFDYTGGEDRYIYPHAFYLVFAEFDAASRTQLRSVLEWGNDEEEAYEDEDEEEFRWHVEELAQSEVARSASAEEVAVVSPDQFTGYLRTWNPTDVRGFGRYSDPSVWPAEELLSRVEAAGELFSMPFNRIARSANRPAWLRLREDLVGSLAGCGDWPQIVTAILDELGSGPDVEVNVHAYSIGDILWALDEVARNGSGRFMPQLVIAWRDGSASGLIGGVLEWDGTTRLTSLSETIGAVYGEFIDYLTARSAHATSAFETELCRLHGLSYVVMETNDPTEPPSTQLTVDADGALRRQSSSPGPDPNEYVQANRAYLDELRAAFDRQVLRFD